MKRSLTVLVCALALSIPSFAALGQAEGKTRVKLLSPGKGKKAKLRLKLTPGSTEALTMTTDMDMSMKMAGLGDTNVVLPSMVFDTSVAIGAKQGADEIAYTFSIDTSRVVARQGTPPQVVQAVEQALAQMKGVTGSGILSDRGISRDVRMRLPAGLPPQMKQLMEQTEKTMEQIAAPFPVQKVGVGAKWRVSHLLESGGMKLRQNVTYRLLSFDGRRGKLSVSVEQTGKPQTFTSQGIQASLIRYKAKGSGTMSFDLTKMTPKATMKLKADYAVEMNMGSNKVAVDTKMSMDMSIAPK